MNARDALPTRSHRPHTYTVPGATVTVDGRLDMESETLRLRIYCAHCGKRAFDLALGWYTEFRTGDLGVPLALRSNTDIVIARCCPRCKTIYNRMITGSRGVPLGEDGAWYCDRCGAFFMKISAARGRVTLNCPRCHSELRVTALDAAATFLSVHGDEDFPLLPTIYRDAGALVRLSNGPSIVGEAPPALSEAPRA